MKRQQAAILILTLVSDFLLVIAAFSLAYVYRGAINGAQLIEFPQFFIFSLVSGLTFVVIYAYLGLYDIDGRKGLVDQLLGLVIGTLSGTMLVGAVIYFGKSFDYSRLIIGFALVNSVFLVFLGRLLIRVIEIRLLGAGKGVVSTIIIGSGALLDSAIRGFTTTNSEIHKLVGVVTTREDHESKELEHVKHLSLLQSISIQDVLQKEMVDEVIIADRKLSDETVLEIINSCESLGVSFMYVPDVFDVTTARIVTRDLAGMPLIELKTSALEGWMLIVKRLFDLVSALTMLALLAPIFIVTAIAIKIDSKGPVIFKHRRVGRYGKEFDLYKFRSMSMVEVDGKMLHASENREVEDLKEQQPNYKLSNDPRVTKVGRFIRKTSIDELPQLLNVVRGEISMVGPRAYIKKELDTQQQNFPETKSLVRRLLTVKPGITGLWQVSGRSKIDFSERVSMDAYYATSADLWLDLKLLIMTIPVVLKGSGAM